VSDKLSAFAFKGMCASRTIVDLKAEGLLRDSYVNRDAVRDHDLFVPVAEDIRAGSLQMQRTFRLLFVLENFVRDFVASRFTEIDGDNWFETRASIAMKQKLNDRKQKEESNGWHTGRNEEPIYYLDFGDLALLITNHWAVFKDLLPDQHFVQSRMQEAERSRNVIAHTNVLAPEEIARLEMYLRDWIRQIG
jgi:hypothetical protein